MTIIGVDSVAKIVVVTSGKGGVGKLQRVHLLQQV